MKGQKTPDFVCSALIRIEYVCSFHRNELVCMFYISLSPKLTNYVFNWKEVLNQENLILFFKTNCWFVMICGSQVMKSEDPYNWSPSKTGEQIKSTRWSQSAMVATSLW